MRPHLEDTVQPQVGQPTSAIGTPAGEGRAASLRGLPTVALALGAGGLLLSLVAQALPIVLLHNVGGKLRLQYTYLVSDSAENYGFVLLLSVVALAAAAVAPGRWHLVSRLVGALAAVGCLAEVAATVRDASVRASGLNATVDESYGHLAATVQPGLVVACVGGLLLIAASALLHRQRRR